MQRDPDAPLDHDSIDFGLTHTEASAASDRDGASTGFVTPLHVPAAAFALGSGAVVATALMVPQWPVLAGLIGLLAAMLVCVRGTRSVNRQVASLRADRLRVQRERDTLLRRYHEIESEHRRQAQALLANGEGTWEWDASTGHILACPRSGHLLGERLPHGHTPARRWLARIHAEDRRILLAALRRVLEQHRTLDQTLRVRQPNGNWRWMRLRARMASRPDGTGSRLYGSLADVNEHRLAEEHRQAGEHRTLDVLAASLDGAWDWDVLRNRYAVSARFGALLGLAESRLPLSRDDVLARIHPEDRERVIESVQRHFDLDEPYEVEFRLQLENGSYGWFHDQGQALRGAGNRIERFSGYLSDITARRIAEHEIRALVAEKQAVLDNVMVGILFLRNREIVSCNRHCEEMFGYGPGELNGQSTEILYRDRRVFERVGRSAYLPHPDGYSTEIELKRKDGSVFWGYLAGRPLDPDRPQDGSIWTYTDETNQRNMIEELRRERDFSEALVNSLPGVFYVLDRRGRLCRWNHNLEKLTGLHGNRLSHIRPVRVLQRRQRRRASAAILSAFRLGNAHFEADIPSATGRALPHFFTAFKLELDGEPHIIGAGMDITARKSAEEQVRQLNLQLESRVRERTAELLAANRELESFSYSVSHDLAAPLRGIDGFSRMIEEDYHHKLDDTGRDYIRRIRTATQRMQALIDDLLSLSRISRNEMHRDTIDMSGLAAEVADELRRLNPHREVLVKIQPTMQAVGDPNLLRILLDNLLRNAWKFTAKHSTALVQIGCLRQTGELVYFVRDDGAGFDMRYSSKLFGAFQRMHAASEFVGNGIGLAIVQRIVQRHGGRIWAEAAVEQGACFYFTLG